MSEISSLYLASVAEQASLNLPWSQSLKTGFLAMRLKYYDKQQNSSLLAMFGECGSYPDTIFLRQLLFVHKGEAQLAWFLFVYCFHLIPFLRIVEPPHDKTNKTTVCPAKTQIIHPGWSESSLSTHWVAKDLRFLHVDSEDSAQADLSLRWAHMLFCWFCHDAAQFFLSHLYPSPSQIKLWTGSRSWENRILWHIWVASWQNPTKWHVRPLKTQISLGIRPVWAESSLSAWRKLGSLATH